MAQPVQANDLAAAAADCLQFYDGFRKALTQTLVLPVSLVEHSMLALLAGGHLLLQGNPGLGKRTLASSTARLADLTFASVSCTPDMTLFDLAGAEQLREDPDTGKRCYQFLPGPLFANVAYVEDLQLAPPRILALLVDSMRRRQIGHGRSIQDLPSPSALIASVAPQWDDTDTALDATVTDRFLLQVSFDYPSESEEWEIGGQAGSKPADPHDSLISADQFIGLQDAAASVEVPEEVLGYAWALVRATRPGNDLAPDFVETWIRLGISPQGLVALVSAAKARALLRGRASSTRRDVYAVALPVFQHRLRRNEEARAAGLTVDRLISMLLERISLDGEYRPEQAL